MARDLLFPAQMLISSWTLAFAMYMLAVGKDAGVYLPIVTGIMGYWLPQPRAVSTRFRTSAAIPADAVVLDMNAIASRYRDVDSTSSSSTASLREPFLECPKS